MCNLAHIACWSRFVLKNNIFWDVTLCSSVQALVAACVLGLLYILKMEVLCVDEFLLDRIIVLLTYMRYVCYTKFWYWLVLYLHIVSPNMGLWNRINRIELNWTELHPRKQQKLQIQFSRYFYHAAFYSFWLWIHM